MDDSARKPMPNTRSQCTVTSPKNEQKWTIHTFHKFKKYVMKIETKNKYSLDEKKDNIQNVILMPSVERIKKHGRTLAIVIRSEFEETGTTGFTPTDFPLQLMIMIKKEGETAEAHFHRPASISQKIKESRHEIIHLISGQVRVDVFWLDGKLADQVVLNNGDTILLTAGHKMEYLKDSKILEIKEGPYPGSTRDKYFFEVKE